MHLLKITSLESQLLEADNCRLQLRFYFRYAKQVLMTLSELPNNLIDNSTFLPRNNPNNTRHGGVGLFYKNSLPIVVRDDLAFRRNNCS